ncbi:MAG: large conductance mechanosensitive channel protein MscL [Verrucomicrobia bacterium]|nr:large conductance mechanosensitive channel protein MscL [Verrucomicrobiota bacterium]
MKNLSPLGLAGEFKTFILKGSVVDLAVGVLIGAAFGKVVDSVVKDLITPLIGMFGGQPDFSGIKLGPLGVGQFINVTLSFLILAAVVFFLVIKPVNALLAMARKADQLDTPPAPPAPPVEETKDVELLREIRDLLKSRPL